MPAAKFGDAVGGAFGKLMMATGSSMDHLMKRGQANTRITNGF
jgi:hypothetical protein